MLDTVQGLLGVPFKTQDQNRRGVGSSDEAKAIGPIDSQAVNVRNFSGGRKVLGGNFEQLRR